MTALAVTGIIASGFLSALGDVLLSALHITDVILGYLALAALATLPLGRAVGRRLARQGPLRVVVTGAVPDEWTRDGEIGDDLPGWVNGCPWCELSDCIDSALCNCELPCGFRLCAVKEAEHA